MQVRFRYLERNNFLNKKDLYNLKKFLLSGKYVDNKVQENFEEKVSKYINLKFCVSVSSGTNAIYLALKSAGIKKNDEVLVPCLSWVSTFTAVEMLGAKAIGVDIDENFTLNINQLNSRITNKTKAIIFVHFSGLATNLNLLRKFCNKKRLILLEDCAQSFGAKIKGKYTGTFGDYAAFSMNPMKIFSSFGEMGLVGINNKADYKKLKTLKYAGVKNKEVCINPELNHKADNLNCFVLTKKLSKLKEIIKKRILIAEKYNKYLTNKVVKPTFKKDFSHIYYSYIIICNKRNALKKYLKKKGIETKIQHKYLICDHKPFVKNNEKKKFNVGNKLKNRILSLTIDENLKTYEVDMVIKNINKFFNDK